MAYKVTFRGLEVSCNSAEDVLALAALASTDGTSGRMAQGRSQQTIRSLVESLPEDQKQLVHLLNKVWPDPTTDGKLRAEMQLTGNKKLAGILSGISKMAKRAGINPIVKHQSLRGRAGERVHRYWLEGDAHAALSNQK
jgi:hypothetical protein